MLLLRVTHRYRSVLLMDMMRCVVCTNVLE